MYPRIEVHTASKSVFISEAGDIFQCAPFHSVSASTTFAIGQAAVVLVGQITSVLQISAARKLLSAEKVDFVKCFIEDCLMPKVQSADTMDITLTSDTSFSFIEIDAARLICEGFAHDILHCEVIGKQGLKAYPDVSIKYFDWFTTFNYSLQYHPVTKFPSFEFNKNVSCLNNRQTTVRATVAALLHDHPNATVTANFNLDHSKILDGRLGLDNQVLTQSMQNFWRTATPGDVNSVESIGASIDMIADCAVALVTETRFFSPFSNFTEKILKCVVATRPFLLLAPPKTLAVLRKLDFQTFPEIFDESYDDEFDHAKRFQQVMTQVNRLLSMGHSELTDLIHSVKPKLIHNRHALAQLRVTAVKHFEGSK